MTFFNNDGLGAYGKEDVGAKIYIIMSKRINVEKITPIAPFISYSKRHATKVRHHELSTHIILDYHPHPNSVSAVIDSDYSVPCLFLDFGFYSLVAA
jgi:hypothetical protein